jgi:hypothetical protein
MSTNNTYEIDLVALFIKVLNILRRNYLIIIFAVCLGIGFSLFKRFKKELAYETRYVMVAQRDDISYTADVINNLNDLIKTDRDKAAEQLKLSDTTMQKVKAVTFSFDAKDMKNVLVKTNLVCEHEFIKQPEKIGAAIEIYVNNIPYFKKRIQQEKEQLTGRIKEYESKIQETDSLQQIFMSAYLNNDKFIYINQEETQAALRQQELTLIAEKNELEKKLENLDILEIINHFTVNNDLSMVSIAGYIFLFLLFGFILIVFKELYRIARKR